jgi:hypothetical protein
MLTRGPRPHVTRHLHMWIFALLHAIYADKEQEPAPGRTPRVKGRLMRCLILPSIHPIRHSAGISDVLSSRQDNCMVIKAMSWARRLILSNQAVAQGKTKKAAVVNSSLDTGLPPWPETRWCLITCLLKKRLNPDGAAERGSRVCVLLLCVR